MSTNGKRFDSGRGAGKNGRIRIYTPRSRWQERVRGQVRWPLHKILFYTREVYPAKK